MSQESPIYPGHPKHERVAFPPEPINGGFHDDHLDRCPAFGHGLQAVEATPRTVQQFDIPEVPVQIEEHRAHPGWCPHCRNVRYAPLPSAVERGGLVVPRLTTWIA